MVRFRWRVAAVSSWRNFYGSWVAGGESRCGQLLWGELLYRREFIRVTKIFSQRLGEAFIGQYFGGTRLEETPPTCIRGTFLLVLINSNISMETAAGGIRWIPRLLLLCIIIIILCEFIPKGLTLKKKGCNDADYWGSCEEGLEKCKQSFAEYMGGSLKKGWAFCDYGTTEEVEAAREQGEEGDYFCYYCFDPEQQPPELLAPQTDDHNDKYYSANEEDDDDHDVLEKLLP